MMNEEPLENVWQQESECAAERRASTMQQEEQVHPLLCQVVSHDVQWQRAFDAVVIKKLMRINNTFMHFHDTTHNTQPKSLGQNFNFFLFSLLHSLPTKMSMTISTVQAVQSVHASGGGGGGTTLN